MAGVAKTRRSNRKHNPGLKVLHGVNQSDPQPGAGELAEFRQLFTAAGAPEEVLRMLDGPGSPEEILQRLVGAGLIPSQEESLAGLIAGWQPLLERGCDPLSAELAGLEFLGIVRQAGPDGELPEVLTELISQVEEYGGPAALAMLRVLAVVGPQPVQPAATEAADRLVSAGLQDRPWVKGLGAPEVGSCFGYADGVGAQEAVAMTFSYGRRQHAVAVLIDHELGGGVKDCWVTDRPDQIRAEYLRAAKRYLLDFRDYEPAEARAIVDRALSKPPCPVAPDQIEDVRDHLDLLRRRVALLPEASTVSPATPRPVGKGKARRAAGTMVHRVKITLRGVRPPIWRRLEVPSGITLQQLHQNIQYAFGWEDYHMWVFETPSGDYGIANRELGHRSAVAKKLEAVAPRAGDRIRYTYDFGDDWEHDIVVEDVLSAEPGVAYPRCITGRRAAPPEDCGGIWGYQELLEILADPGHEEHEDRLEWLGLESADEFDPAEFDLDEVNEALSGLAKVIARR